MGRLRRAGVVELGVLGDVAGLDVVELGCGTAYFSAWLARQGARPVGVDLDACSARDGAADAARDRASRFRSSRRTRRTCRLRTPSFDLAVSEYGASLWCDPARWIPEAARLLRPAGRLVFLTNSTLTMLCVRRSRPGDRAPSARHRRACTGSAGSTRTASSSISDTASGSISSICDRVRRRAPRRALRARRGRRPRVLRHHDRRLGAEVAERGSVGGAQARLTLASTSPQRRAILEQLASRSRSSRPTTSSTTRQTPTRSSSFADMRRGRRARFTRTAGSRSASTRRFVLDGRIYGKAADRDRRRTHAR